LLLLNRVYQSQEEMLAEVESIAVEIAKCSPMAVYGSKKAIDYSIDHNNSISGFRHLL